MAKWILVAVITVTFKLTLPIKFEGSCKSHENFHGQQLICTNTTSSYFHNFDRPLNKTYRITCGNCSLTVLQENTFNFSKNNVSSLYLLQSGIRELKKFAFQRFPLLKVLVLRGNFIETVDRKAFNGLKRLLELDLSRNNLKILTNSLLSELENLDIFSGNNNGIFYIQPEAFAGLINLKYLYLSNNALTKLENSTFRHLTNLKILFLEHNDIFEIHSYAFDNLRNLNYLYLNNNSISALTQYNFKPMSSLVDLQLRWNNLSVIETSSFNGLYNIKYLYLGQNHISAVRPYGFVGLNTLEILELTDNDFTTIDFHYFNDMENLNMLWLGRNSIRNVTIEYKVVQNSLTILDLSHNNLTWINYKVLFNKFPSIREISIGNNSWDCDFLEDMYSFFENRTLHLCTTDSCSANSSRLYLEDVCYSNETSEDLPPDTSMSGSTSFPSVLSVVGLMVLLPMFVDF